MYIKIGLIGICLWYVTQTSIKYFKIKIKITELSFPCNFNYLFIRCTEQFTFIPLQKLKH